MAAGLVITCEHATSAVPAAAWAAYREAAAPAALADLREALASHRGFDPGAAELATDVARLLGTQPVLATASRLWVDCNRSSAGRGPLGTLARALPPRQQAQAASLWRGHWRRVVQALNAARAAARTPLGQPPTPIVHLAVHSFVPTYGGVVRAVDIGLLYDPARPREREIAGRLAQALAAAAPALRIRRNRPYRGVADGLPTALRRRLVDEAYVGIELEVSQALVLAGGDQAHPRCGPHPAWPSLRQRLAQALAHAVTCAPGAASRPLQRLAARSKQARKSAQS